VPVAFKRATDGFRASGRQHLVQARHAGRSPTSFIRRLVATTLSITVIILLYGVAYPATAQGQEASSAGDAANASNNPLTPKITLTLQNYAMPLVQGQGSRWSDDAVGRLYVPFKLGDIQNILRIYAPIDAVPAAPQSPGGTDFGLGDWTVFDLVVRKTGGLEYGAGPRIVVPNASRSELGSGKWQPGAAAIAVQTWSWGLTGAVVYYSHSVGGDPSRPTVQSVTVQPLILYNLNDGYYLRSSGIWNLAFDTGPSYIPIGLGVGKIWTLPSGATLNLHLEPQYSVYHSRTGAPLWQVLTGVIVQF
jgi:hypothetical protein